MVYSLPSLIRNQCSLIHFAVISLVAWPMAMVSPGAAEANDFRYCAGALIDAGVDTALATSACAQALHPDIMANCVLDVSYVTEIEPTDALATCSSDRRPDEVATCVVDIAQRLEGANKTTVVENCGLSFLPVRYSDCVLGIAAASDLEADASLTQCIAAGYLPTDLAPTFIFSE
jgi:hypothetical protein